MLLDVHPAPVAGVVEHGRRRGGTAKWLVVADINPTSPDIGLAAGKDGHPKDEFFA